MKRFLIFMLAPVLVGVAVLLLSRTELSAIFAFGFTLAVSAFAGPLDEYLARVFSIPARAALTATGGAIIACIWTGILSFLPPAALVYAAFWGALSMGTCSLLASDFRVPRSSAKSGQ